jgi:predicted metal-dependent hydrolase
VTAPADQLTLFGSGESVRIRRSSRARRLALKVFPHGAVEVVAPLRVARGSIEQFVQSNAAWIARARDQFQQLQGVTGLAPPDEIRLRAIAERWEVEYAHGRSRLTAFPARDGGRLLLVGRADPQWRRERLRAWLMARARDHLAPWLAKVSVETGLPYTGVTIRRQRSRWGSCSARRTISLNCALLFLDPPLVRHLLVHELAHTRHLDHSRKFWALVGELEPEYEMREAQLRDAWRSVPAWVSYDPA